MKLLDELPAIGQEIRIKTHNNKYIKGTLLSVLGDYLKIGLRPGVETFVYKPNILDYGNHIWPPVGNCWSDE